jgi:hypothetical protein
MVTAVVLQIISTFLLTGLSWYVQLVHYPLFHHVTEVNFSEFHKAHVARTNLMVLPLLPVELITSAITAIDGFPGLTHSQWWLGLALVVLICLSTWLIQIPLHEKLANQKNGAVIDQLVLSHWLRTLLWTVRSSLLCGLLIRYLTFKLR